MKKAAAILLSLSLAFSMSACNTGQDVHDKNTSPITEPATDTPAPEEWELTDISSFYKIEQRNGNYRYWVYDGKGGTVADGTSQLPVSISMIRGLIVDVQIGDKPENTTHQYYHPEKKLSSPLYTYVCAANDTYVAYLDGTLDMRTVVVCSIFDDSFRKETSLEMSKVPMPVIRADLSHGNLYLQYNIPTDSYTYAHIPFLETEYDYFGNYDGVIRLAEELYTMVPYYEGLPGIAEAFDSTDEKEHWLLYDLYFAIHEYTFPRAATERLSLGYAMKDLNGDGTSELLLLREDFELLAILTLVDGKPVLLDSVQRRYHCSVDENGLIHTQESSGADYTTWRTYRLPPNSGEPELIWEQGTDGHEWIDGVAVTKYYKLVNGEKVYVSQEEWDELSALYPYPGVESNKSLFAESYTPLFEESPHLSRLELHYRAALENRIQVFDTQTEEYCYLQNCRTPYLLTPLPEADGLRYVSIDLDGDGERELVIDCGDGFLILRHHLNEVYLYSKTFRNMYSLHTDGSYNWNHTGQSVECGERQITFEGTKLISQDLWRTVNHGTPEAEYYVGEKQVTYTEFLQYVEDNPKEQVSLSPLSLSWQNKISYAKAMTLAEAYWSHFEITKNGYAVFRVKSNRAPTTVYVFVLKQYVPGVNVYSTVDEIWIDVNTGEAILPYTPDGK